MTEIGDGIVVGRRSIAVAHTDLEYENIASGSAGQRIVAAIADQDVVAALAFQRVVTAIAGDDVVELGAAHGADAAHERVMPDGAAISRTRAI